MINRGAVILKWKQPGVDWINDADPADVKRPITVDEANEDQTVYLVSDEVADTADNVREWIVLNFELLFEEELFGWYVVEGLWPEERTLALFDRWFDVQYHSLLIDTVDDPIRKEEE